MVVTTVPCLGYTFTTVLLCAWVANTVPKKATITKSVFIRFIMWIFMVSVSMTMLLEKGLIKKEPKWLFSCFLLIFKRLSPTLSFTILLQQLLFEVLLGFDEQEYLLGWNDLPYVPDEFLFRLVPFILKGK